MNSPAGRQMTLCAKPKRNGGNDDQVRTPRLSKKDGFCGGCAPSSISRALAIPANDRTGTIKDVEHKFRAHHAAGDR